MLATDDGLNLAHGTDNPSLCISDLRGWSSAIINASLPNETGAHVPWLVFLIVMGIAAAVIVGDIYVPRKRIDTISAIYFGLVVGTC